jgi:hypothetical protein
VTSRTPTPGLGWPSPTDPCRGSADYVWPALRRVSPPMGAHVTCDVAHGSTAPDDSSGRLGAPPSV